MRRLIRLIVTVGVVIAILLMGRNFLGFGGGYRTDLPPPPALDAVVWPAELGGVAADIGPLDIAGMNPAPAPGDDFAGLTARYGQNVTITVISTGREDLLDSYVATIRDGLDRYGTRTSGKVNGLWSIRASGAPGRLQAWQVGRWFYSIEAGTDALFDAAVAGFPYIAPR